MLNRYFLKQKGLFVPELWTLEKFSIRSSTPNEPNFTQFRSELLNRLPSFSNLSKKMTNLRPKRYLGRRFIASDQYFRDEIITLSVDVFNIN